MTNESGEIDFVYKFLLIF